MLHLNIALPMLMKMILPVMIFLLMTIFLVIAADLYLPSSVKKDDVIINLQPVNSEKASGATRNDLVITQSGEKISIDADTGIVFRGNIPVTVFYTPILHKISGIEFTQDETIQHIDSLYLSRSYNIFFALFVLSIIQIIYLLQWSKGKKSKAIFLYASVLLYVGLLGYQYFR